MPRKKLSDAVEAFLQLALLPPEKEPRTQRAQHENECMIIGFNRAQETLRTVLHQTGHHALAETRADGQRKPLDGPGGVKMWVVG